MFDLLPEWIPREEFDAWLQMRKLKKVPNTDFAIKLAIRKLSRLRAAGQNVTKVLEESILHGWTGLYEPDERAAVRHEGIRPSPSDTITEEQRQRNLERYRQKHPERFQ